MPKPPTLDDLRRYAVSRTLFKPTTLLRAIEKLGFVQADPIRAPARAQDLTLRHRVIGYRAGDLERRYAKLAVEEDCLVNYGFLPRKHLALMHPRVAARKWDAATKSLKGPVKNVSKTPLVAGQWQKKDGKFELVITTNTQAPEIPVGGELVLL